MDGKKHIITDVQTLEEIQKTTESELKRVKFKIGLTYFAPIVSSFLSSFAVASIYFSKPDDIFVSGGIFGTLLAAGIITKFNPDERKYYDKTYGPFDSQSDFSPSLNEQRDALVEKLNLLKKEIKGNEKVL